MPPVTAEQILGWYQQVEQWLSCANQAASSPSYRPDLDVPADLPPWAEVEPCPSAHLEAMLGAAESLRTHAEAAMIDVEVVTAPSEHQPSVQRVRQLLAEANSKADYAKRLWTPGVPQALHEQIERLIKEALERYFHLGQFLAMPEALAGYAGPAPRVEGPARASREAAPGRSGRLSFDPWSLTDPAARSA